MNLTATMEIPALVVMGMSALAFVGLGTISRWFMPDAAIKAEHKLADAIYWQNEWRRKRNVVWKAWDNARAAIKAERNLEKSY